MKRKLGAASVGLVQGDNSVAAGSMKMTPVVKTFFQEFLKTLQ
jgi:hypothetical protein